MFQTALNVGSLSSSRDLFHWDLAYCLPTYLCSSFPYYHSSFFPHLHIYTFPLLSFLPFLTLDFKLSLLPVTSPHLCLQNNLQNPFLKILV